MHGQWSGLEGRRSQLAAAGAAARSVTKVPDPGLGCATEWHHPCNGPVTDVTLGCFVRRCHRHFSPGASRDAKPMRNVDRARTRSQTVFTRNRPKRLLVAKLTLEVPSIVSSEGMFLRTIALLIHGALTALYEFCHDRGIPRASNRFSKLPRAQRLSFTPRCTREPLVLHDTGVLNASLPTLITDETTRLRALRADCRLRTSRPASAARFHRPHHRDHH